MSLEERETSPLVFAPVEGPMALAHWLNAKPARA
jgi:hypothetical protein